MNRNDFMRQLESLLQSIAPGEREEALQYYNDYFDDAGKENEQEVIEALGNPARVAESIRRDLLGSGYGEGTARKALASDRALMKYGEGGQVEEKESEKDGGDGSASAGGSPELKSSFAGSGRMMGGSSAGGSQDAGNSYAGGGQAAGNSYAGGGQAAGNSYTGGGQAAGNSYAGGDSDTQDFFGSFGSYGSGAMEGNSPYTQNQGTPGWKDEAYEKLAKPGMPVWAIALLVTVLVLLSPAILGVLAAGVGALISIFAALFGLIFAFGAVSLCMLGVLFIFVIVGVMCIPANPWVGMTLIGSGLICGAIGILFLMLTVAVGAVVPVVCKGLAFLFRRKKSVRG